MKRLHFVLAFALAMGFAVSVQGVLVARSAAPEASVLLRSDPEVTAAMAAAVIHASAEWGMSNFGLSEAQMMEKYVGGSLRIEVVSVVGGAWTFRVSCGGLGISVILDNF